MTPNTDLPPTAPAAQDCAPVLIHLLKGVLYRDQHPAQWQLLAQYPAAVRDYFAVIGLVLMVDEAEGYAYLKQREPGENPLDQSSLELTEEPGGVQTELPRLVARRQLSYPVSLLCVLLRKRLIEQDSGGGETRVVLSRDQIVEMMRVFLPDKTNEARLIDQINRHINKVVEFGFLRPLKDQAANRGGQFEVRRIIKALFNADWLANLEARLAAYQHYVAEQENQ